MKFCETCGKTMETDAEVSMVNGKIQCQACAAAEQQAAAAAPIVNQPSFNQPAPNFNTNNNTAMNYEIAKSQQINTNGWAKTLKTLGIIAIIIGILASIVGAIAIVAMGSKVGGSAKGASFASAALVLVGGTILSFISQALIMCFAQLASDVSVIKNELFKK